MTLTDICSNFASSLGGLFSCEEMEGQHRIRTPFLYPDGDNIDIFLRPSQDGVFSVTDLGETLRWLRMQTASGGKRSPKQRAIIEDVCMNHGVELYKGMLVARCKPVDDLGFVVTRVAQAALRVSDLWFTFRNRAVESVSDEVAHFLTEKNFSFERGQKLVGRSGKIWTGDFHVRAPQRSSMVMVLSTGSRSAAKNIVSNVHTAFYDLNSRVVGPEALQFISLFDDSSDVWGEEDFRLAEQLSSVARWTQPESLVEILKGVA